MFWFLPLLGKVLLGGAVIGAAGWAINKYVIPYLTREILKDILRNQPKMEVPRELNNFAKERFKNGNYNECNIGLFASEDIETERVFAGTYYDGEVQSIVEIEYKEIESDLKRRLDREEIVIL